MTNRQLKEWQELIWNAIATRIQHRQSLTANEILEELAVPPHQQAELRRLISSFLLTLQRKGHLSGLSRCNHWL